MSSVPGPIISFRISQPELAGAIQPALQQIRQQSQTISNGIAEDWKRMAAQIRASMAQGLAGTAEEKNLRTQLVSLLDCQITGYRQLNELSTRELTNLKAMTLERERQANALKTGTVGLTAGTQAFLSQLSGVGGGLVSRLVGSLGANLFGVSGGSQLGGVAGVSASNIFAGIASSAGPATLAVGGLTAGIASTGAILAGVTKSMLDYAQSVQNVSAATGLSYSETQKFRELAKITGVDADGLTQSFGRLQSELGKYIVSGKDSEGATQNFVRVLDKFNISVTDSGGKLRPIGQIMSDFAGSLAQIPDQETRTAIGMDAMGIRGKILVQVLDNLRASGMTLKQALDEVNKATLSDDKINELLREKQSWNELVVSIDAATLHLKAFIATHKSAVGLSGVPGVAPALGALGLVYRGTSYFYNPGAPGTTGVPTAANAQGLIEQYAAKNNELLLNRAEILKAGGQAEYELLQAEQKYAEAVKASHGADAEKYANEIISLKEVLELERQRTEERKRLQEFLFNPSRGNLAPVREARSVQDLINNLLNPGQGGAPDIGIAPGSTNYLAGIASAAPFFAPGAKQPLNAADLLTQINKEHEDLFRSQASIDAEHYQDELDSLNEALKKKLISQQEYNDAALKLAQDRNKTLNDADKKYEDEAGGLFEDLISGKTKSFSEALLKDVENIALGPVKKIFEQLIGSQLQALSDLFSGKKSGAAGGAGGIWGTITGKIGGVIGPGGTPGWWPGAIGGGAGGGIGGGPGQVGTMNVAAQVVNLTTLGVAQTGGGPGGGLGNFFGANSLLGGFGNFFGNLNPFGGSGSPSASGGAGGSTASISLLTKILGAAGPFAAGAATLGMGLATGNEAAMAIGAATLASKAATALSGISALPAGLGSALGTAGTALPGIGIGASGIISAYQSRTVAGQVGGTLEAGAGGALAGLVIGGPIGAAIGGAIGLIGGTIASIFGGGPQGFQQSVTYAMAHNQYHAPLSENFSFASNGSIANTLGTGFQQNGSSFSQYALPANTPFSASALTGDLTWQQIYQLQNSGLNPNAPFLGNPSTNPYVGQGPVGVHATSSPNVNVTIALPGLIDANQIASTLAPHITSIAQMVSKQVANSSSGFASNVRRAAFPP
jgi:hypothetical protein